MTGSIPDAGATDGRRHSAGNEVWDQLARHWAGMGSPLRPGTEDVGIAASHLPASGRARIVVAGVTPELCSIRSAGIEGVIAVDRAIDMIRAIWPGPLRPGDAAVCGDWQHLPIASQSAEGVLADGSLSQLAFPRGGLAFMREVRRVLRPGGRCLIRCFTAPHPREGVDDVLADLAAARIGSINALKLRLAMAVQRDAHEGVAVRDVWAALAGVWPDLAQLAQHTGWPPEQVLTIQPYKDAVTRYAFPTAAQYLDLFAAAGLSVIEMATPAYELGECCPTYILGPR